MSADLIRSYVHLSPHFTVAELTASATAKRLGIDNTPSPAVLTHLGKLATELEKVRALTGLPLLIHSAYRCPKLNDAVGGSPNSLHLLGLAADFDPPDGLTHDELQRLIISDAAIVVDLILEERAKDGAHWLHFQLPRPGKRARRVMKDAELDRQGGATTRVTAG